jgi:hypothetical protein
VGKVKAKRRNDHSGGKGYTGAYSNPPDATGLAAGIKRQGRIAGGFHRDPTKAFEHAWNLIISESED